MQALLGSHDFSWFYLGPHSCQCVSSRPPLLWFCLSFVSYLFLPSHLCFCQSLLLVVFNSPFLSLFPPCLTLLSSVKSKKFRFEKHSENSGKKKNHCFDKCFESMVFFIARSQIINEECLFASSLPHSHSSLCQYAAARCSTPQSHVNWHYWQ